MKNLLRIVAVGLAVLVSTAWAAQPDRISTAIDGSQTVVLKGSVSPQAQHQRDLGPLDPSTKLPYVTLVVPPSAHQQAALDKLLAQQQDPTSPKYHKWLTPEQFGQRFGLSHNDIDTISGWLRSQGFSIAEVARGQDWIAVSGTVAQFQSAFHTEIHRFMVDGEERFANATEISIPQALGGVVTGFRGLNDFRLKPMIVRKSSITPDYTFASGVDFLAPDDIATIYDIGPLYTAGTNGTGMKLAVMGQTDIVLTDITQFRTVFNLPAINLTQTLATGCSDPGITGDEGEADLDLEWSGAVARDANIIFIRCDVPSGGVVTSLQYAVNNNTAPVLSMSYGACESSIGSSYLTTTYRPMIQQANTQGQTLMVSSDDSGAAGCDPSGNNQATGGLAVNGLASPPEVTAVGGTEFNEGSGNYWNSSNGSNGGSAKSYIPELAWDDSNAGTGLNGGGLGSTGGGASLYFNKPSWQTGPGKFDATFRSVPDISMPASADHDGYIFCTQNSCSSLNLHTIVAGNSIVGGTSVSCPVFAGLMALLNQSQGNAPPKGLGNINPTLYQLVQSVPSAFHDVPAGNYNNGGAANPSGNMVPCQQGKPNCPTKAPFQFGFLTGTGYDEATGLGSVDASLLVANWSGSGSPRPTTTTLTLVPTFVDVGSSSQVAMNAVVKPTSGSGTPTGSVDFFVDGGGTPVGSGTLSSGKATFNYSPNTGAAAQHTVRATYNGDASFAGSTSTAATLDVVDFTLSAPNPATVTISAPGNSGTTVIGITPLGGFSQTPTFTCSPLPSEAACSASGTATSQTITFTTTAATQLRESPFGRHGGVFYAMLLPGLIGLVWPAGSRKRMIRLVALMAILACLTLWMPACGGGPSVTHNPGTPTGNTTVTVTASSGSLQHSVQVTLTVN
jgi:subtilase family serine protease